MNAMAHRRKTTTYGKVAHKPTISTREAFAKAAKADVWNSDYDIVDWSKDAASTLAKTVNTSKGRTGLEPFRSSTKPSAFYGPRIGMLEERVSQDRSSLPVASQCAGRTESLDESSSGHDCQQRPSVSLLRSRKKRKINSEAVIKDCSFVYDDITLQRHVAAESGFALSRKPSRPGNARSDKRSLPKEPQDERESCPRHDGFKQSPMQKSSRRDILGQKKTTTGKTSPTAKASPYSHCHVSGSMTPPQKVLNAFDAPSKDIMKSTDLERMQPIALGGSAAESRKPPSPYQETNPPVTPSRPVNHGEGTTTPRQWELWSKLSFDDTPKASPSTLDLPRLNNTDMRRSRAKKKSKEPRNLLDSLLKDPSNTTRKRIVDTLQPYNLDKCCEDSDSGEDSEISSNGETSELAESEASIRTHVLVGQNSPDPDSHHQLRQSGDDALSGIPPPILSLHTIGPKLTYARQRSYLANSDLDEVVMLSDSVATKRVGPKGPVHKAVKDRLSKTHSTEFLEHQRRDSQSRQTGGMRSIHELREAGGNVRLICELEAILDDFDEEPSSSRLRRTRLLDLNTKFLDQSSSRLFIDQGLEPRFFAHVGSSADLITNFLLATAILQLIANPTSSHLLSQIRNVRIVGFLVDLLGLHQDLTAQVKLQEFDLSKYVRQEFSRFCSSLLKSAIWRVDSPSVLSCHTLALQCLEHLVRQTRESSSPSETLSPQAIKRIISTSLPRPTTPYLQCLTDSALTLELTVSILESCTVSNAIKCQECLWEGKALERLIVLLPILCSWKEDDYRSSRTLTLRLYVNLTNNNPKLCEDFSTPEIAGVLCRMIITRFQQLSDYENLHQRPVLLDDLILSLGAFVNLAESSDTVRQLTMRLQYANRSFLSILLELFITKSKNAAEVGMSSHWAFSDAYTILGTLCGRK